MGMAHVKPNPRLRDARLSACPHCGNTTHLEVEFHPEETFIVKGKGETRTIEAHWKAYCCADLGWGCGASSGSALTEQDAIDAWNRRKA